MISWISDYTCLWLHHTTTADWRTVSFDDDRNIAFNSQFRFAPYGPNVSLTLRPDFVVLHYKQVSRTVV